MTATIVHAHGIGGRQDLPIPFSYALVGGGVAVVVSFLALGLLWKTARLRGEVAGRPLPSGLRRVLDSAAFRLALRLGGLVVTAFVATAAVFGHDDALNPTAGFVYVLFWVGLVPASLLFGPVWKLVNPLRTIHLGLTRLLRIPPEEGMWPLPAGLGYWPAAAGLFAFTWLELVYPERASTATLRTWFGVYAGVHLLAAAAFGSRWFDRGDAFEVYSSLVGRLSPVGRRADRRLVLRNPFDGLDGLRTAPGLVATVCVMLGSTAYDGFSNSPYWIEKVQTGSLSPQLMGTLGLTSTVAFIALTYTFATWAAGGLGAAAPQPAAPALASVAAPVPPAGPGMDEPAAATRTALPRLFAHSIIPIAVGYVVAHYFSLFVFEGQHTLILSSDPLGRGWNLFGTAERGVDFGIVSPAAIAVVQVCGVVAGHVLGVVAAHDRAVRLFPRRQAVAGQLPLLLLMVGYTLGGLTLLFAG